MGSIRGPPQTGGMTAATLDQAAAWYPRGMAASSRFV
jgi:hypothetical protein